MRLLCNDLVNTYIFTLVKIYDILVNASIIVTLADVLSVNLCKF
jgi:hypothetical protein